MPERTRKKDISKINLAKVILGKPKKSCKPFRHSNLFGLQSRVTSKEGKKEYMRLYMQDRRRRQKKRKL